MPLRVVIVALAGVNDSSFAVTLDGLMAANRISANVLGRPPPFCVDVATRRGKPVRSGAGMRIVPTCSLRDANGDGKPRAWELAIVPGMGMASAPRIEAMLARRDVRELGVWLQQLRKRRAWIASSCSGVFVLAAAGLLDGKTATTTWWLLSELENRFPRVQVDRYGMVVEDGRIVTAGAAFAQLDLLLRLISRLAGPELADLVARYLVIDERPSQARYATLHHAAHASPLVRDAERWIRARLPAPIRIADIAAALGTTHRTLARRVRQATGLSPLSLVQQLRVEAARHLLATTRLSVDEIAARVGYESSTSLRRVLARHTGAGPRELRGRAR